MSKQFVKKNIRLSLEFDKYVSRNANILARIPNGAYVVITVKGDETFNRSSRDMVKRSKGVTKKVVEARKEGRRWAIRTFAPSVA